MISSLHHDKHYLRRARDFSLASLAMEYPGRELFETLKESPDVAALAEARGIGEWFRLALADPLKLEESYTSLFELGKARVSLYETEHGRMRGMSKGNDLADIAGFYTAFGLELDDTRSPELLDQVAVEFEFCAHLLFKLELLKDLGDQTGIEIVEDALGKFIEHHLGRFVDTIAATPSVKNDPSYGPVLAWCSSLVEAECARFHVQPAPLDFFPDTGERDSTDCATVHLPLLK